MDKKIINIKSKKYQKITSETLLIDENNSS